MLSSCFSCGGLSGSFLAKGSRRRQTRNTPARCEAKSTAPAAGSAYIPPTVPSRNIGPEVEHSTAVRSTPSRGMPQRSASSATARLPTGYPESTERRRQSDAAAGSFTRRMSGASLSAAFLPRAASRVDTARKGSSDGSTAFAHRAMPSAHAAAHCRGRAASIAANRSMAAPDTIFFMGKRRAVVAFMLNHMKPEERL